MSTSTEPLQGRWSALALVLLSAALGCGGSDDADKMADGDEADAATHPEHEDAGALAHDIPSLNGCAPQDYVDMSASGASRVIAIANAGLNFAPRCMIIAAGQSVRWEGSLTAHPLAPGNPDHPEAGSAGNPIAETSTGRTVEFTFPDAGTYPYHCTLHAFGAGQGMAGSIHVQ